MGRLEERVELLEAVRGSKRFEHVIELTIVAGGNVDTTGWVRWLKSENNNGSGLIFRVYDFVPPRKANCAE